MRKVNQQRLGDVAKNPEKRLEVIEEEEKVVEKAVKRFKESRKKASKKGGVKGLTPVRKRKGGDDTSSESLYGIEEKKVSKEKAPVVSKPAVSKKSKKK